MVTVRIKGYEMVYSSWDVPFNERMKELIEQGWEPYGEPFTLLDQEGTRFAQAMVLTEVLLAGQEEEDD